MFNWVDLVILGVFLFYLFEGLRRGFIEQAFELVGFVITVFLAIWSYKGFAVWVSGHIGVEKFAAEPIAFFGLWFFYQVIYSLILRLVYPLIPAKVRLALPNRLAGLIPAFAKAFIIIAVISTVIVVLPVPGKLKSEIGNSFIGSRFVNNSSQIESYLSKIFGHDIKDTLTFLTVPAQTEQIIAPTDKVDLKFTTEDVSLDTASEQKMLILVNQERVKVGLPTLQWDEQLAAVARAHSRDMFAQGYFAHDNLLGQSPFDRMQAAGIKFEAAGENIAYAPTLDLAHNGLMRSPGHRANILSADFHKVGIGVIDGGIYGKMFTQDFTN